MAATTTRFTLPLLAAAMLQFVPLAPPVQAGAPQVRTQAPGFYRMMLGDFEITVLSDGTHAFPIDTVMNNITPAQIARGLDEAGLAQPLQGSINAFLVNTGSRLILIDAGAGALYGDCCGKLLENLRAAGYQPEQVDTVLLTHLHKDHAGGVMRQGAAAFPNAVLRMAQGEADYWLSRQEQQAAPEFLRSFFDSARAAVAPYQAAGRFQPYAAFGQLETGVRALPAPGHTPGHAAYLVASRGRQLLIWGDIVHVAPLQFPHPDATVKYDSSAAGAQRQRRQLLDLAASQRMVVGAAHIAFPGLGRIGPPDGAGASYRWLPVNYEGSPGAD
jgi:glyoxylase-like metal-dependent hydrolase (beta-lactamase superfamily II)